jgi:hypothetical protein
MYDKKAKEIFNVMMSRGLIPYEDQFIITEELLNSSVKIGEELFKKIDNKRNNASRIRFHKKIAGLNMLALNEERAALATNIVTIKNKTVKQNSGFVYLISNSAFPEWIKVGITKNLEKRLSTYQTYDPLRRYIVEKYSFVEDSRYIEKLLLNKYKISTKTGEWISSEHKDSIYLELEKL